MAPSGIQSPLLETHGLVKRFGTLVANDQVDLAVRAGEIQALLGENGAGKSTLVKMLYGLLQPDAGHILWEGRRTMIVAPRYARQLGIGMVFQHFSLFEAMTVAENIALGLEGGRRDTRALGGVSMRLPKSTAWPSIPSAMSMICPSASDSASRSCAACCRLHAC